MSRRDVSDGYVTSAEHLAALVSQILPALSHAGPRTFGGRWRDQAELALSRFRAEQQASRQQTMFGESGGNEGT